jgi:site-specific recombinase XerD
MRLCRQQYKNRHGETRESAKWYVDLKDHDGRRRRIPGFTDKGATTELGRHVEKLIALRVVKQPPTPELSAWLEGMPAGFTRQLAAWGILDSCHVGHSKPLSDHVADFKRSLEAKANTARHVTETAKRVSAVLDGCGFKYPSDLSAARVASWLADQRAKGMGATTSNHYLTAVKGFCAWLVRERRMTANPLGHLSRLNSETDVRRERRTVAPDVFARLVEAAGNGPTRHGLTGRERAMLYRTAAFSGLRASELASLTVRSFDLKKRNGNCDRRSRLLETPADGRSAVASGPCCKAAGMVSGSFDRRGRGNGVLAFNDASEANSRPLWPGAWAEKRHAAAMLREDLADAEIAYADDSGKVFDFHALRHQFISSLAKAGVHPKTAQELARHSTITLTLDRYSHVGLYDQGAALASLPVLPTVEAVPVRATGTDNATATPGNVLPNCLPKLTAESCTSEHQDAHTDGRKGVEAIAKKKPAKQGESPVRQKFQSGEIGIRTRDAGFPTYRISNPALSATQPSLRVICGSASGGTDRLGEYSPKSTQIQGHLKGSLVGVAAAGPAGCYFWAACAS